jgi:predicted permease
MRTIRHAFRVLFRTPFVTSIAILSLALGIGANSAIFSMFDRLLLTPLPVPAADALVNLSAPGPKAGSVSCSDAGDCDDVFSYPMFRDLEARQQVLTGLAAHSSFGASFAVRNEPTTGSGLFVSGSYFPTLGLQPAAGRLLTPADDGVPGTSYVAVLSHAYWSTRFGGDSAAIGQTMLVNGSSMTIVGVAPADFHGTTFSFGRGPEVYVPISMREVLDRGWVGLDSRRTYWIYVFGRLRAGVGIDEARVALNGVYRPIINEVEAPLQQGMTDERLQEFRAKAIGLEPGWRGQSTAYREAKTPLWLLFGVTGIVLLIACANIANLLLARGAGRSMEMGVRLSLGATRGQLLRQLLTESVVLAALGGIASLLVAKLTLFSIAAMLPPDAATAVRFEISTGVVMFAALLALVTGLTFGMFPALHSTRSDLVTAVRSNAGQIAGGRAAGRFRATLVTAQIALSMALLASAGLFLKSLINATRVDLGIVADNVVTFAISPRRAGYDPERARVLYTRLEQELATIPGVTSVTSAMVPVLAGSSWGTNVRVQGYEPGPDEDTESRYNQIGPDYFATIGTPIVAGRTITGADAAGTARVAVVNETFVRRFALGTPRDAVGKFMAAGGDSLDTQIIGVAKDAGYSDVKDAVEPVFFRPWRQRSGISTMYFYVRSSGNPASVLGAIGPFMKAVDPSLPIEDLKTLPAQIRENLSGDRMISRLTVAFALLATLLAGVGLYGVLAYTVAQRTREIGVRMALGADGGRVRMLVLRQVALMTAVGGVLGVAGAIGLGRAARGMLFGLQPHDPLVFSAAVAALVLVAFVAAFVPAQRAASVSPIRALRYE